jgi:large subunit ribosomal protein L10
MDRATKEATVDELKAEFAKITSLVVADYRGINVPTVTGLRNEFRKAQCVYRVYKNTLVKRAIQGTKMEGLSKYLEGTNAIMFSYESPSAPAKVATKFAKENEKFKVKAAYFEGQVVEGAGVESLASMPGKDEMRAMLLATFIAPATKLVQTLAAGSTSFVYLLAAREKAQQGTGDQGNS